MEDGRRFRTVAGRRRPSHGMAFARTVLILSKSTSLEHKSDAPRLRRNPACDVSPYAGISSSAQQRLRPRRRRRTRPGQLARHHVETAAAHRHPRRHGRDPSRANRKRPSRRPRPPHDQRLHDQDRPLPGRTGSRRRPCPRHRLDRTNPSRTRYRRTPAPRDHRPHRQADDPGRNRRHGRGPRRHADHPRRSRPRRQGRDPRSTNAPWRSGGSAPGQA